MYRCFFAMAKIYSKLLFLFLMVVALGSSLFNTGVCIKDATSNVDDTSNNKTPNNKTPAILLREDFPGYVYRIRQDRDFDYCVKVFSTKKLYEKEQTAMGKLIKAEVKVRTVDDLPINSLTAVKILREDYKWGVSHEICYVEPFIKDCYKYGFEVPCYINAVSLKEFFEQGWEWKESYAYDLYKHYDLLETRFLMLHGRLTADNFIFVENEGWHLIGLGATYRCSKLRRSTSKKCQFVNATSMYLILKGIWGTKPTTDQLSILNSLKSKDKYRPDMRDKFPKDEGMVTVTENEKPATVTEDEGTHVGGARAVEDLLSSIQEGKGEGDTGEGKN